MKKFTLLIAMFICAIGFSQQETSATFVAGSVTKIQKDVSIYQNRNLTVNTSLESSEVVNGTVRNSTVNYNQTIPNTGVYYGNSRSQQALLYDNGSHFNIAGNPNLSRLEDVTLGMGTYGLAVSASSGTPFRIADEMVLTDDVDITDIDLYGYQTGAPTAPASINAVFLQIWDGDPSAGGSVVWGDTTTNLFDTASWGDTYRELESAPGDTNRAIQVVKATTTGLSLTAGTYWLDWSLGGDAGFSGPWQPPVAILGQAATGNGLQWDGVAAWTATVDSSGDPMGFPFQVYGTVSGGGGACANALLEVNQDIEDTCMANITQGGLAQSYIALEPISAGAGIKFTSASVGDNVNLSLWDGLPNAGGTMLAAGTTVTANDVWVDVFWDPVVNITVGDTYYIVIEGDASLPCIAGSTIDPYAGGNLFANSGYVPFPNFDYTFRTYSCDGGGGGCAIVSDCNLIDTTPDDATSADIWDRPFAGGTCCSGLGPVSYDVYGPFTVDTTGLYDILNVQVGWDGYLFVYENCFDPLDQLAGFVAGDDDGAGGIGTSDIIDVMLTTGTDYYVITTGFGAGDFGDFETTITGVGAISCGAAPVDNDLCVDAIAMSCGDTAIGDTSDNTDTGGNVAPDEWYSFTGTGTPEFVTFSLCDGGTSYDSLLRVFDACGGTEIAVNDDFCGLQSEVTFTSDGTSTYYIMIEGFGSSAGVYSLEVSCMLIPPPPVNDECTGAIAVSCGESVTGTTIDATIDTGVAVDCGDATITSPGVWYTFTDTSGLVSDITLTMCSGNGTADFDTKMSVFTGDCGAPPLTCVDGNDDTCGLQSEVSFQSDGVSTYYILVHSFGGATGNFTFDVNCTPVPPPNDDIANSITIDVCPFTDPAVAMPAATLESGNPAGCNIDGATGVWYNITPAGDGTITATIVSPSGLSHVTFYTAADENASEVDLTLVDQIDNQCLPGTTTTIDVVTDQVYYVFVVNTGGITDISFDCDLLAISDNVIEGFSFYPNPSTDVININSQDLIENVSIFNILGQKVIDQNIDATSSQINVANLAQGTYIMKATVNGVTASYKVIKK